MILKIPNTRISVELGSCCLSIINFGWLVYKQAHHFYAVTNGKNHRSSQY